MEIRYGQIRIWRQERTRRTPARILHGAQSLRMQYEIPTETTSEMDLGIVRWHSQEYDRLDSHSEKMEDLGHQLTGISERRHKFRSLVSTVQYQAATQEVE